MKIVLEGTREEIDAEIQRLAGRVSPVVKKFFVPQRREVVGGVRHVHGPRFSAGELRMMRDWHKDPVNHYKNGMRVGVRVVELAKRLNRAPGSVEKKLCKLRLRKVAGVVGWHATGVPAMHAANVAKKGGAKVEGDVIHRRGESWSEGMLLEFKRLYPSASMIELSRRFSLPAKSIFAWAAKVGCRRDRGVTRKRVGELKREYMLRRKAVVPKREFAGVVTGKVDDVPVQVEFPKLRGVDCRPEFVQRSFLSLARREFKEISFSAVGGFVLGIKNAAEWDEFVADAALNFARIAGVLGVGNKFRVGLRVGEKVICYG